MKENSGQAQDKSAARAVGYSQILWTNHEAPKPTTYKNKEPTL